MLRPVDPDVAGASDAAVLHGYLHREHIGRDALRREVEQPRFAAVGFGVPPLALVGPGREFRARQVSLAVVVGSGVRTHLFAVFDDAVSVDVAFIGAAPGFLFVGVGFVADGAEVARVAHAPACVARFLVGMGEGQVAVVAGRGAEDVAFELAVAVFGQEGREAVLEILLQRDVLAGEVADLVAADVAHVLRSHPDEAVVGLVNQYARDVPRTVGQHAAVAAVFAGGVGQHVETVAVLVAHQHRVFRFAVGIGAACIAFVDRRQAAFAYGKFAVGQRYPGVYVHVGQLVVALHLLRNVGRRA